MTPESMPRMRKKEKMPKIDLYLPAPLLEEAEAIALQDGWSPSEFHRMLWESGLGMYLERSNKRLVNKQLRTKLLNDEESGEVEESESNKD